MVHIISQQYQKRYLFPYFSFTFFLRITLIILTIIVPFFIVYNSGNFYQSNKTSVIDLNNVKLKPTYQYYIKIQTSTQTIIYTNFWINKAFKAINIKFMDNQLNSLKIKVQLAKELKDKVKMAQIFIGFEYEKSGQTNFGLLKAQVKGYNLAQASISGLINFQDGKGQNSILKSDNIIKSNQYNFPSIFQQIYQSSNFISYHYSTLPISLPTDLFQLNVLILYPLSMIQQSTPTILGQILWSWIQYFPILLVIYWLTDKIWIFLLKQGILKRTIKHDKQYLQILRKQQDKNKNIKSN